MSGIYSTWIKIRKDLFHDPAVISISERLHIPELHVVGILAKLWAWADDVTAVCRFGAVPGVTLTWVDRFVGVPGFADAMVASGWLTTDEAGIVFPNFDRHMSQTAKERALHQLRQKSYRSRDAAVPIAPSQKKHKTVTREEKRREEDKVILEGLELAKTENGSAEEEVVVVAETIDPNLDPFQDKPPALEMQPEEMPVPESNGDRLTPKEFEIVNAWNDLGKPYAKVRHVGNGERRRLLKARLKDPWWCEHWKLAIPKFLEIPGLKGVNNRSKPVDFDFFLRPDSVTRIIEGKYDGWGVNDKKEEKRSPRCSSFYDPNKFAGPEWQ